MKVLSIVLACMVFLLTLLSRVNSYNSSSHALPIAFSAAKHPLHDSSVLATTPLYFQPHSVTSRLKAPTISAVSCLRASSSSYPTAHASTTSAATTTARCPCVAEGRNNTADSVGCCWSLYNQKNTYEEIMLHGQSIAVHSTLSSLTRFLKGIPSSSISHVSHLLHVLSVLINISSPPTFLSSHPKALPLLLSLLRLLSEDHTEARDEASAELLKVLRRVYSYYHRPKNVEVDAWRRACGFCLESLRRLAAVSSDARRRMLEEEGLLDLLKKLMKDGKRRSGVSVRQKTEDSGNLGRGQARNKAEEVVDSVDAEPGEVSDRLRAAIGRQDLRDEIKSIGVEGGRIDQERVMMDNNNNNDNDKYKQEDQEEGSPPSDVCDSARQLLMCLEDNDGEGMIDLDNRKTSGPGGGAGEERMWVSFFGGTQGEGELAAVDTMSELRYRKGYKLSNYNQSKGPHKEGAVYVGVMWEGKLLSVDIRDECMEAVKQMAVKLLFRSLSFTTLLHTVSVPVSHPPSSYSFFFRDRRGRRGEPHHARNASDTHHRAIYHGNDNRLIQLSQLWCHTFRTLRHVITLDSTFVSRYIVSQSSITDNTLIDDLIRIAYLSYDYYYLHYFSQGAANTPYSQSVMLSLLQAQREAVETLRCMCEASDEAIHVFQLPRFYNSLCRLLLRLSSNSVDDGVVAGGRRGLEGSCNKVLAMMGYCKWKDMVRRRGQKGLRILSLDGGGSRGVLSIRVLKEIRDGLGCELHEVFDIICGTSTGGIIALLLGIEKISIDDLEQIYDSLIKHVFHVPFHPTLEGQNTLQQATIISPEGTFIPPPPLNYTSSTAASRGLSSVSNSLSTVSRLLSRQAFYDETCLQSILTSSLGDKTMIDSASDPRTPKVFCLSTKLSTVPSNLVIWRNYNYPPPSTSSTASSPVTLCEGSFRITCADALRATTAAPFFFAPVNRKDDTLLTNPLYRTELTCLPPSPLPSPPVPYFPSASSSKEQEDTHGKSSFSSSPSVGAIQCEASYGDGALLANNPAGVALSEARRLFSDVDVECLVSVGTGCFDSKPSVSPSGGSGLAGGSISGSGSKGGIGWSSIVTQIVSSATNTEGVHALLSWLLPESVYFRFNPVVEFCGIDEARPSKLAMMKALSAEESLFPVRRKHSRYPLTPPKVPAWRWLLIPRPAPNASLPRPPNFLERLRCLIG
eukprot:GHVQ01022795.1.p1 GENE.GHVQ01022795.1~~GHVQ01022795.1.p1  ORF type:complete len:1190 (+),score=201.74 GHVQ01022795.1:91-3660(+)